jgi:hypothetical protein
MCQPDFTPPYLPTNSSGMTVEPGGNINNHYGGTMSFASQSSKAYFWTRAPEYQGEGLARTFDLHQTGDYEKKSRN